MEQYQDFNDHRAGSDLYTLYTSTWLRHHLPFIGSSQATRLEKMLTLSTDNPKLFEKTYLQGKNKKEQYSIRYGALPLARELRAQKIFLLSKVCQALGMRHTKLNSDFANNLFKAIAESRGLILKDHNIKAWARGEEVHVNNGKQKTIQGYKPASSFTRATTSEMPQRTI